MSWTMDPLEISQLGSANMDWLLHFQKSQSSPDAPWLLNPGAQESRGKAVICISRGASRPHCCWESERKCHTSLSPAVEWKKSFDELRLSSLALKVLFLLVLLLFTFFSFLASSVFRFFQKADPAWLQALISRASEPRVYWLGLQSANQM